MVRSAGPPHAMTSIVLNCRNMDRMLHLRITRTGIPAFASGRLMTAKISVFLRVVYGEHYTTRVQSMCTFLMMGRSLHPAPTGMMPDYGLSLRERYSPRLELDGTAR